MKNLVHLENVKKMYCVNGVETPALVDVNIIISSGDFCAIAGPSGSGKTTLLNIIGCLDRPTSGSVSLMGSSVKNLSDGRLSRLRAEKLGFVFQFFNLIQSLSVIENVEYPLLINKIPRKEARNLAMLSLEDVGLFSFAKYRPNQLSGGQQQRVAIARALVKQPLIVLADEPTGNLDSWNSGAVMDLMFEMAERNRNSFIISTHDVDLFEKCPKRIRIIDGRVVHAN
ncbi:MAG: ABC transporter ATP-binding protein [Syntrophales bacterium]|jgi:putative ABC transport system ATP-binding protein|nr:ABC transporter ATP-binding protein [Syntrophales bacterium]MCK9527607.1 ABC transporter ATP-binding protein [Syntrophales bacterium]MDX9922224.1 ABC transporter ATP-binding protein [Syntrophales bacterium]